MKPRRTFFPELTPLAHALDATIEANAMRRRKPVYSVDDHAAKLEKQAAKLARRAARVRK